MQHPLQCLCAFHDQNGHLYLAAAAGRHIVLYALQPASQSVLAEAADYQLKQSPPSRFLFAEVQEHATASLGSAPITSLLRNRGELIALCPATKSVLTYELTPSQLREIFSTHEGVSCASGTEPSFNHSISPRSNSLSKRPCAATQIPSSNLLAVADKFGDVYVLPKHSPQAGADAQTQDAPELKIRSNAPAANHLTVHSQRNRRALREQRRRVAVPADSGSNIKPHSPPNSSPLLGHVSMLADVEATHAMGQNLLITADRDEHVRISSITNEVHRARSFCLGHLTFLCKVCFLSSKEDGLISGDGDAYLHVWKATAGRLLQSFDLQRIVDEETYLLYPDSTTCTDTNQAYSSASSASTSPRKRKYSVHRIMSLRLPNAQFPSVGAETQEQIVVSMQNSEALVFFAVENGRVEFFQSLRLPGKVLDICQLPDRAVVIISLMAAEDDGDRAARGTPLVEAVELLGVQGATRWAVMHSENDLGRQLRSLESVEVSDDVDFLPLRNEMFPAERMRKSEYSNAMPNVN